MNKGNEKKVLDRFGKMFTTDPTTKEPFALFGFENGDGWFLLIWDLCEKLELLGFDGQIQQVKEKFGTLIFYVDHASKEQHDAIRTAEKKSEITCEICGDPGEERSDGGWVYTRCDGCYGKKYNHEEEG